MTIVSPFPLRLDPPNSSDRKMKSTSSSPNDNLNPKLDLTGKGNGNGNGNTKGNGNGSRGKGRERGRRKIRWGSIAYQLSFSFFILLISVLLAGSGWGLSEQALRGGRERLNIFIVLAAYVFFVSPPSLSPIFPLPRPPSPDHFPLYSAAIKVSGNKRVDELVLVLDIRVLIEVLTHLSSS